MSKKLSALLFGILSIFGSLFASVHDSGTKNVQSVVGTPESGAQWISYPQFLGWNTKIDPQKLKDGENPSGQNTSVNEGDRVSVRQLGFEQFPEGSESATTTKIKTLHNFRKRTGENILIRSTGSVLQYFETGNSTWTDLHTGYGSDDFDFADNNVNTDQNSYTYFGNAVDPFSRWNGGHSTIVTSLVGGEMTITVSSTASFYPSGTLYYCGTSTAYASSTATTFNLSAPASACSSGTGIAQAVDEYTGANYPRGNIYMLADNRLFISGVASTTQAIFFSKYGDALTFDPTLVNNSTAASAGIFNLAEGGGAVTAMVQDQGSLYFFKRSMIYQASLSDSLYTIVPLKSFDQKSQTTGSINRRSTFTSANGVFYITPDNQIMYLTMVQNVTYPQIIPISDVIRPTTDALDFSTAVGIVFRNVAYFAAKQSTDSANNDTVLVYNIDTGHWDTPVIGWNVGDVSIYQKTNSESLYFGDAITQNTYKVNTTPQDAGYGFTANWRTKQLDFGIPTGQKYMSNVYVEGYIGQGTTLNISLLLDENGFSQIYRTTIKDTDTQYLFDASPYNPFGLSPFGLIQFGSNQTVSGLRKFRVYLGQNFRQVPFYNATLEFSSSGENQNWQVTNYSFLVQPVPVPERRSLFKAFS